MIMNESSPVRALSSPRVPRGKRKRNNNEEVMVHFTIFIFKSVASIRVTQSFPVISQCFVGILTGSLDGFGGGRRLTSRGTRAIDSVVGSVR